MQAQKQRRVLSGADLRLLVLTTALVAAARVALWVLPTRVILRVVRGLLTSAERQRPATRPTVDRIGWAVDAAARRIPHASCLTQAVAGQLVFRRYGYATHLHIGVCRDETGVFRAHAWIERDGRVVVGGSGSRTFTRLELPGVAQFHHMVSP